MLKSQQQHVMLVEDFNFRWMCIRVFNYIIVHQKYVVLFIVLFLNGESVTLLVEVIEAVVVVLEIVVVVMVSGSSSL